MNKACEAVRPDLPLYAEGELRDPAQKTRIRLHLRGCPECREWIAGYDSFSRTIAEGAPAGFPEALGGGAGELTDEFTRRVMVSVRRIHAERKAMRFRRLAAAVLVLAGLGAGGMVWLGERASTRPPGGAMRELAWRGESAPAAARERKEPTAPAQWWVLGPEGEVELEKAMAWEIEAMLYSLLEREISAESRDYLELRALVEALSSSAIDRRDQFLLLMVPEEGGPGGAIAVRPVALPVRVAEGDLAAPARQRLNSPRRRYRILWQGNDGFPASLPSIIPPLESPVLPALFSPPSFPREAFPAERY